jgi:cytochrome b involved in lipid metabolism
MKKTFAAVTAALVLSLVVAPSSSAAVKAGAACKKAGQTSVAAGMKYTCVKKGSKLVWGKGVAVKAAPVASASAAPSVSVAPTASAAPMTSKSAEASKAAAPVAAGYTMERVKANGTSSSCWTVISGNVYDLTKWIGSHPGGSGAITSLCGTDGTSGFMAMHRNQSKPEARLAGYLLGPLAK